MHRPPWLQHRIVVIGVVFSYDTHMAARTIILPLTLILFLCVSPGMMASKEHAPEAKCDEKNELPEPVQNVLKRTPDVLPSCRLKPSVIQGDFDGDSHLDYAVLVTRKMSRSRGFLIVFGSGRTFVAGAGRLVQYGDAPSRDLNFDHWELYRKDLPVESSEHQPQLKLHGDALFVSYHEGASGLFYWDGKRIRWYQQGD
jgi:hypothetical protein